MAKAVIVTTEHRGIFFGYLNGPDTDKTVVLTKCRNAIYFEGPKGFLGLADPGPTSGCRIGAVAPRVVLHDVTSISDCTPEAAKIWDEWDGSG